MGQNKTIIKIEVWLQQTEFIKNSQKENTLKYIKMLQSKCYMLKNKTKQKNITYASLLMVLHKYVS